MNTELILAKVAEHVEVTDAYKHYLDRPVLPGFKAEMNDTKINVESDGTTFVNREIDLPLELSGIEDKATQVRRLAKKKHCKLVGINKSIAQAEENYEQYYLDVVEAMKIFRQLCDGWCGYEVHVGYSEDIYYNHYLQELEFKLQKMHYMNTLLMRYKAFAWTLDNAIKELSDDTRHYTMMSVIF